MKSSAISIVHQRKKKEYLINLIDSPGHIEFSSEVSSALRLTDGALVVVDVIEGVSSQTLTVLRQCFEEKLKMILVLNKIDRLKINLNLDTESAFNLIREIIEHANAALSSCISSELASQMKHEKNLSKEKSNFCISIITIIRRISTKGFHKEINGARITTSF